MVSHPELGLDPPIRSNRESGRDTISGVDCVVHVAFIIHVA